MDTVHYSQEEPRFELVADPENTRLDVFGSGFLGADLVRRSLRRWAVERRSRGEGAVSGRVCIDLRNVTGYGAGCATLARDWLQHAGALGVQHVALIASSAVLRTASTVIARGLPVSLRCFDHLETANEWLHTVGIEPPYPEWTAATGSRRSAESTSQLEA